MRKRERENPCVVCGHYHKYEEGEVCATCGHRIPASSEKTSPQASAFPSEILPDFLYLGSYDNASRAELLKTQGISRVLNTVPACQNLYKNSFTYHCLQDDRNLPFDDAIQFLEQCERDKARVLVHCMSGKNRSPAVVIAYLMKRKGWRLAQSYQWVKDRRPLVEISSGIYQQLQEYEQKIFGSNGCPLNPALPSSDSLSFNLGFPKPNYTAAFPTFNLPPTTSIFSNAGLNVSPHEFTFGGETNERMVTDSPSSIALQNGTDTPMDSSWVWLLKHCYAKLKCGNGEVSWAYLSVKSSTKWRVQSSQIGRFLMSKSGRFGATWFLEPMLKCELLIH